MPSPSFLRQPPGNSRQHHVLLSVKPAPFLSVIPASVTRPSPLITLPELSSNLRFSVDPNLHSEGSAVLRREGTVHRGVLSPRPSRWTLSHCGAPRPVLWGCVEGPPALPSCVSTRLSPHPGLRLWSLERTWGTAATTLCPLGPSPPAQSEVREPAGDNQGLSDKGETREPGGRRGVTGALQSEKRRFMERTEERPKGTCHTGWARVGLTPR